MYVTYMYMYMYIHTHTHTYRHTCTYIFTYICTCVYVHAWYHSYNIHVHTASVAQWQSTRLESRVLSVRVPPEAAHFSLEKKELSRVLLCCVCVVLLCFLSRMFIVFIMYMYLSCMCHRVCWYHSCRGEGDCIKRP